MEVLYYKNIDFKKVSRKFFQVLEHLKNGNFSAAGVKKMPETGLYRARLDYDTRLVFKIAKHRGQPYLLLLEVIYNHDYSRSLFLRGDTVDEAKLISENSFSPKTETVALPYVNPGKQYFYLLDKIISFDDVQEELFHLLPPLIIIGSAGSGKTALALEKLKMLKGNILYITLSAFLAEHAARLYYSHNYENEEQEIDFLSFREFVESIRMPQGREIDFRTFESWFISHKYHSKIKDAHKLFEEFKGVITGGVIDKEFLSEEEYIGLGIKQSVFLSEERPVVYNLFEKYLTFLKENNFYDINILSHRWLPFCKPNYDFIIVDEVQDINNIQLYLIIQSLKNKQNFFLCGDSNQIVHPNFFSWSKIKTMFYLHHFEGNVRRILSTNYRNSPQVTELSNKLLKVKNSRFGSIDKESNYLISSVGASQGEVVFLEDTATVKNEFNQKTRQSTKFAVLVMRNEDKAEARKFFNTPLLFSVQEAKGLEYENILLFNFISGNDKEFREISSGVSADNLLSDELRYSRAVDKGDKSLEVYKFYINSLYVAITRGIRNVYIVEQNPKHQLLSLLGLINTGQKVNLQQQTSSMDDWQREAQRLEKQGRNEQADHIRQTILGTQPVPWKVITIEALQNLKEEALNPKFFNKKAKDKIFDYALIYNNEKIIQTLVDLGYKRAGRYESERNSLLRRYYIDYANDNVKQMMNRVSKYGVDYRDEFNLTPLMAAVRAGATNIIVYLLAVGAKTELCDNFGKNVLQTALFQSFFSKEFTKSKLGKIYPLIVAPSIKVKADNRLVKIDNHKFEFILLNLFIALQKEWVKNRLVSESFGLKADDLILAIEHYPENIMPLYRKQRAYISGILARNEIYREDTGNKKLFLRLERGYYTLNADLEIEVNESWVNVYDLIKSEKITIEKNRQLMIDRLKNHYDLLVEQKYLLEEKLEYEKLKYEEYYDHWQSEIKIEGYKKEIYYISKEIDKIIEKRSSISKEIQKLQSEKAELKFVKGEDDTLQD